MSDLTDESEVVVRASPFQKDVYVQLTPRIALPRACLQHLQDRLGLQLSKVIVGEGKFGVALEACQQSQTSCNYIVKLIVLSETESDLWRYHDDEEDMHMPKFGLYTTREDFEQEASIARWMGQFDVGPRILTSFLCPNTSYQGDPTFVSGIIVAERMDVTILEALDSNRLPDRTQLLAKYRTIVETMIAEGIDNPDLHLSNIMLRFRGGDFDVRIVDWGIANYRWTDPDWTEETRQNMIRVITDGYLADLQNELVFEAHVISPPDFTKK